MKTIGYVVSHKNNERRRALLPQDAGLIGHRERLTVERGYGEALGYSDEDYRRAGVFVADRGQVLASDVIVDVKLGDADFLPDLAPGKTLVGWAHIVQKTEFTDAAIAARHTVVAWENIMEKGRYLFYRNRELAGETAVLHAFSYYGRMPYDCRVAVIGNGMTARGALRILNGLGAKTDVFTRKLEPLFRERMGDYDVLVNCVRWDTCREDRLIYRSDLKRLRRGSMIIDVSCDPCLEIETSRPTTFDDPVYTVDGVLHYAVDNTPAMAYRSVSEQLSRCFSPYVDSLLIGRPLPALEPAFVIRGGIILDPECVAFRSRTELLEA
ncbi:MAG: N(5)-(carboxyethyl)ornithine synthase [Clostridiales bacterium]|nr:N(5)-(carboxyethyl)ornithine synthase [Clostridiales bacterium]